MKLFKKLLKTIKQLTTPEATLTEGGLRERNQVMARKCASDGTPLPASPDLNGFESDLAEQHDNGCAGLSLSCQEECGEALQGLHAQNISAEPAKVAEQDAMHEMKTEAKDGARRDAELVKEAKDHKRMADSEELKTGQTQADNIRRARTILLTIALIFPAEMIVHGIILLAASGGLPYGLFQAMGVTILGAGMNTGFGFLRGDKLLRKDPNKSAKEVARTKLLNAIVLVVVVLGNILFALYARPDLTQFSGWFSLLGISSAGLLMHVFVKHKWLKTPVGNKKLAQHLRDMESSLDKRDTNADAVVKAIDDTADAGVAQLDNLCADAEDLVHEITDCSAFLHQNVSEYHAHAVSIKKHYEQCIVLLRQDVRQIVPLNLRPSYYEDKPSLSSDELKLPELDSIREEQRRIEQEAAALFYFCEQSKGRIELHRQQAQKFFRASLNENDDFSPTPVMALA